MSEETSNQTPDTGDEPSVEAEPSEVPGSAEDNDGGDGDAVTLTLNEVLELEEEMMEDTAAVLGAASDKTCSYTDDYIKRQALYSCLTCIPEAKDDPEKAAGVCLACSYHCHEGHDLVELYTKRNFCCDCGNKKFPEDHKCTLCPDKRDTNILNTYNQNFSGVYCVCHRPYPDPDDPVPDEMIQCIICEDWYHSRHLGTVVPSDNFAEMICEGCVTKHEFLLHYDAFCLNKSEAEQDTEQEKPSEVVNVEASCSSDCKKPKEKGSTVCAKFWTEMIWRKELCKCETCLKIYETENVAFLLDPEDPVQLYEERSKAKAKELAETHNQQLDDKLKNFDRVAMINCIEGYNDLKEKLAEFLRGFAGTKRIIREEDVREFFDTMQARKKQKIESGGQYFCR
ncbi:unnamed protein product [Acanthoscelides obtectus]|uniref:UBR-type domain-containing protein n=1 Tax=Acanthoscelides obtectus TaxID=200917 RepID=A0A9P0M9I8_ACAOB|nr:unnamed protein product [Acanthoscelides obtectus]CAK1664107.1 Putative E3 ubiquitin-protein ligase UBR7 [Acanthoscelides obtectus]